MFKSQRNLLSKRVFIWFCIILLDVFLVLFLGIATMRYDDNWDEAREGYSLLESFVHMDALDKAIHIGITVWYLINITGIIALFIYVMNKLFQRFVNNKKQ